MRRAGRIVAETLEAVKQQAHAGATTGQLDKLAEESIVRLGGQPAFKGYHGFPASICTSINEQVVHGIPGPVVLREGDILSVDCGAFCDGYIGDAAVTIEVGAVSPEAHRLVEVTREALAAAIEVIRPGVQVADISRAVQQTAEAAGFSVVKNYTGHGIGSRMHEEPAVPNFVPARGPKRSPALPAGATVAIEPMVNAGGHEVEVLEDGWTVVTKDGALSAHFEHTIAVTAVGASILTQP